MKKALIFLSMLLLTCLLCSCFVSNEVQLPDYTQPIPAETVPDTEEHIETTVSTEPEETFIPTEPEETFAPTDPEHSPLYIPGVETEDVIRYFNEVCLDAEFEISGDSTLLQKWDTPIYIQLNGEYTEEDYATLMSFTDWLNTIHGFPGIYISEDLYLVNLRIYFCTQQEMIDQLGDHFYAMDGGVVYWYRDHRIYDATVCYRTDLDQYLRNSVILEEIYNGLGPIQDTSLRPDSIIYAEFSQPQELTEIDELILRLLYHPDMKCGMNADECAAVIRLLYY